MIEKFIKITKDITCHGGFKFYEGEEHKVLIEGKSSEKDKKVFIVESNVIKNNLILPIAIYEDECRIIN